MFSSQGLKGKFDNFVHQRLFTGLTFATANVGRKIFLWPQRELHEVFSIALSYVGSV